MAGVRDHTELQVWKLCAELRTKIDALLERPGLRRAIGLSDQLDRAADSLCPNIAEGFARFYPRENARFVRIAKGSLSEVLVHLERARHRGLIGDEECAAASTLARRARAAATRYVIYLENTAFPSPSHPSPKSRRRTNESD